MAMLQQCYSNGTAVLQQWQYGHVTAVLQQRYSSVTAPCECTSGATVLG